MNAKHTNTLGVTKEPKHSPTCAAENAGDDDRLLVAQAKLGYAWAFGVLYERHRSKIYRAALRIVRNQPDAEDAVQRTFQRAFTNLAQFREDSTFSTWVTRVAINEALMLLRQRRANVLLLENDSDGTGAVSALKLADKGPTPEQAMAQTELRSAVIQAISKLRHNLRVVVLLHEVHGLTAAEIARRLGLSVGAVKSRTFHARRHLRRQLECKFGEGRASFLIGARD